MIENLKVGSIISVPTGAGWSLGDIDGNKMDTGCVVGITAGTDKNSDDVMWVPTMIHIYVNGSISHYTAEYLERRAKIVGHRDEEGADETS